MIKNIIFDLGGVLINLDMAKTRKAFENLGMKDFNEHYNQAKQSGLFDLYDCGKISDAQFRDGLKKQLPATITDKEIDEAWNAMLLDLPKERLNILKSLQGKYRLFLLSNTNEIHIAAFSAYLKKTYGFEDFSGYFEKHYYSCRIGMRKPHAEVFEFVLRENHLNAGETLFIDDSSQHVAGASACGIHALLMNGRDDVISLLHRSNFIS
jgi:glucose-1-phosphatase